MTEDIFVEQIAPIPDNDYFYYVQGELQVGSKLTFSSLISFVLHTKFF
jgi:hypothetical protein